MSIGSYVPSEGPQTARILVVGETPWKQEGYQGRPFVGQSGKLQDRWWVELGLNRGDLLIDNLNRFVPSRREIESLSTEVIVDSIEDLHRRVAELPEVNVIAALGNYATFAFTGKGKVRSGVRNAFSFDDVGATTAEKKAGITKLRGSVYPYRDLNGRMLKVVPVIHPAAILQAQGWEKRTVRDWSRVITESVSREIQYPSRKHIVDPEEWQVEEFVRFVEGNSNGGYSPNDLIMSVDIETWGNQLSCVGFALSPWESITIPLIGRQREVFFPWVKRLCESQCCKVLQNGLYDWYWLGWYGIWINNFMYDTSLMHHAIDPAESHSLDFLASIYCPFYQFWKDEAKDAEEIIKYAFDLEALWVYNGLDCCYTRELFGWLWEDLVRNDMVEFYFRHYVGMLEPLCRTMLHGVRVDKKAQKEWAKRLRGEMKEIHEELNEAAEVELFATESRTQLRDATEDEIDFLLVEGEIEYDGDVPKGKYIDRGKRKELEGRGLTYMIGGKNAGKIRFKEERVKKDFSKEKLLWFFHEKLGLPKQYKVTKGKKGKSRGVSLDEGSIRKMTAKWPGKIGNWGNLVLAHREKKKELDYLKGVWDKDGRIRCGYKMLTVAGRLSSSKNPMRRGLNLQNIKR